ncbi:multicopper oxidase family protein [Pseudomonas purpurea]|uniref:multicopper oxidase family protein n=1 Tax=Pseudomonas purpurea TaxID=3136737 RepID=UPI00326491DF
MTTGSGKSHGGVFALASLALMCQAPQALADEEPRLFSNPPGLEQQAPAQAAGQTTLLMKAEPGIKARKNPQPSGHEGHERQLSLHIDYTASTIFDPGTGQKVPVSLRSYRGTDVNPDTPFVAPTIEVTPGDTVRVTLANELPEESHCDAHQMNSDEPHCFNATNLHSHGLWVSPSGNSDNVLLSINPKVTFQYEYNIPADHPAGTFWYHPHRHGSTAIQVASGMAGALIIRGDRMPTENSNGDIDTLLKVSRDQAFPEKLLVMQQIPYACKGADGQFKSKVVDGKTVFDWSCLPGEIGVVESFDQLAPNSWNDSRRYTSINGLVQPTFAARAGQIERWRLVHAGIRDTVNLQFRKLDDRARTDKREGVATAVAERFIEDKCTGEPVQYHVIASDGLTMDRAQPHTQLTLQPGYRNDLLMVFPEPGRYCVIDNKQTAKGGVSQFDSQTQLLGFVDVGEGTKVGNISTYLTKELVKAAKKNMPDDVKSGIVADLQSGLQLKKFVAHKTIAASELIKEQQQLVFLIDTSDSSNVKFAVGTTALDAKPYESGVVNRQLKLGDAQTWVLKSAYASHPFHIHVNPFQIDKIIGPSGTDLSLPGAVDPDDPTDNQYAGLKGVWKDTLFVKGPVKVNPFTNDKGIYTIYVNTRYQRYIGEFVLHCHILDHEDQGMMQNVSIGMPNGQGGVQSAGH